MTGIPDWAAQEVYDIEATSTMPPGLSGQARDERMRAMVQALLVDRFKLVIHRESKEMPVYALVVAKGGPKLQGADIDDKDCPDGLLNVLGPVSTSTPMPDVCHVFNGGRGRGLHARAATIADLAAYVESWTDRPLLDKAGLTRLYRFDTKGWLPMDPTSSAAGSSDAGLLGVADSPTVFQMFEDLGLRMEAQKGVVDVYVIDHLERACVVMNRREIRRTRFGPVADSNRDCAAMLDRIVTRPSFCKCLGGGFPCGQKHSEAA
jgi:uncharacterized protein (TIGR03435 family)